MSELLFYRCENPLGHALTLFLGGYKDATMKSLAERNREALVIVHDVIVTLKWRHCQVTHLRVRGLQRRRVFNPSDADPSEVGILLNDDVAAPLEKR